MATQKVLGIPIGKKKTGIASLLPGSGKRGGVTSMFSGKKKSGPNLGSWATGAAALAGGAYAASRVAKGVRKSKSAVDNVSQAGKKVAQVSDKAQQKMSGGPLSALGGGQNGEDEGAVEGHVQKFGYIIAEQIEVAVNRRECYNQWTQFKDFSQIFRTVESVDHPDEDGEDGGDGGDGEDDKTTWAVKFGPARRQWEAEITEQIPDKRIAWKAKGGANLQGVVTFHELADELTRVQVQMVYRPQGFVEHVANWFRWARVRTRRDLRLFKNFMEFRAQATGEWRGRIEKEEGTGEAAVRASSEGDSDEARPDSDDSGKRSEARDSSSREGSSSRDSSSSSSRKRSTSRSTAGSSS